MKNLEQLIEDLKTDEDLRAKMAATGDDQAVLDAILAEAGYDVTGKDIMDYSKQLGSEPGEDVLRAVAGGSDTATDVGSGIACCIVGAGFSCWMDPDIVWGEE